MNKFLRTALVLALFACASSLLIVTASAQSVYGSVFGTVSDKSGAVIPNATITVTDEAKGTVVTATSNGSGDYSVPHLIPDVYDLKVVAKGFKPFETKGITVQADTAPRIDPTLDVGSDTGTTVEVNAEPSPAAEDGQGRRCHRIRSAAGFEPSGRRPELHQPSTSGSGRTASGLVARGRRKPAGVAADPGGRPGVRWNGFRAGRHRQSGPDSGNHRHQSGNGCGDGDQDHHAELRR